MPFESHLRSNLLILGRAYAKAQGVKLSTVSRYISGDPPFLEKLANGSAGFTVKTYDKALAWFDAHWPEGAPKPGIWRPREPRP